MMVRTSYFLNRTSRQSGRSLIELVLSWALIFVIIGAFAFHAERIIVEAKEAALKAELRNVRLAVMLYKILNREYPANLSMLVDKAYEIRPWKGPKVRGRFLRSYRTRVHGELKDPFGKNYLYNPLTGMVKSQTEGYNSW